MKPNMGTADRLIRLMVTALITFLYLNHTITGVAGIVLMIVGVVFLLTSFIGFCPLYKPFGFSTKK